MAELVGDGPISYVAVLKHMEEWDSRGCAMFDFKAAIARDKSNIPFSKDILTSADKFNDAPAELRREILYFQKHNPFTEANVAISYFKSGAQKSVKCQVGVKPESKEGGRAVTSERSDVRKANTLVTNNLLPLVDQIPGSLMAASPAKKERAVHRMSKDSIDASRKGCVPFYLATDFEKFGHSLGYPLQKAVFEVVAEFFGEDWIGNIPDMLLKQEIVCIHGEHFASFDNETGGDGQGMRNAVWQLMLAACMIFVSAELEKTKTALKEEKPLDLLYFMDDHLFRLLVLGKYSGQLTEDLLKKFNRCEDAICAAYNKVGLGTNPEKNTRSLKGAILTGMKISVRGRENVPGRAIQRAYV
jgi:hypothetical protein